MAIGAKSAIDNFSQGNYIAGAVDTVGVVADAVLTAIPGAPGVVGLGIQVSRQVDNVADAAKASQGPRYATGELREQVMDKGRQADGTDICTYCDKPTATQSDHVVAYSKGGETVIENLVPACSSCNPSKGNKELGTEWIPPKEREP